MPKVTIRKLQECKMSIVSQNIESMRKRRGLLQEQVAEQLAVSRPTYINIESGKREPNADELQKLAAFFDISLTELFSEPRNNEKFKQMYFFILECMGRAEGVAKTKLAKLLYLADFRNFYEELEPMSGVQYVRREYGPVADLFFELTDDMFEKGEIGIDILSGGANMIIKSKKYKPDSNLLSEEEKNRIKDICRLWKDKSTKEIVNFTHEQKPWKACLDGEYIPYSLIIQEDPDHVYQPVA
jgi:transcriptional regulator with XRE-family HTH domain